ncbi:craniofacial development protein 2-like [Ostrea edulis]|uniref:craniofacial development protein 2-like n=1 Tax=Ostrea edulis TaxID=37623 RepID=UPI0024AE948C|nr:craniofacial development protein 2-like [Ostrea edulis]
MPQGLDMRLVQGESKTLLLPLANLLSSKVVGTAIVYGKDNPERKPGPTVRRFGVVLTAPPCKKVLVTETENQNQTQHQDNNGDLPSGNQTGQMNAHSTTRTSLLRPKQSCYIGAWNVRTMYETGKAAQIEREMNRYNIQILGVSESRWTGNGIITTNSRNTIIYSGREDNNHREGVAIIMTPTAKKSMIEWEPINERLMTARFNGKYVKTSIIVCYAPTNDAEEEQKDTFYQQLQKAVDKIPTHDVLLIIGDLNAKVGSSNEGREKSMGKHGCGTINDNGERLVDICELNNCVIGGIIFPHKEIHKKTWISPNGRDSNQIDHIIINGKWRHSLKNVIVRRGADVGSGHHLLLPKIRIHLRKAVKRSETTRIKYHTARLRDPGIQKKFSLTLRNRFQTLGDIGEGLENNWNAFRDSIIQTSADVLGTKTRSDKDWIQLDTWKLIDKRKLLKQKKHNARSERVTAKYSKEYSECNKETKRKLRKDKREYFEAKASEAEEAGKKKVNKEKFSKSHENYLGNITAEAPS